MIGRDVDRLSRLLQRARNSLWRWRSVSALWHGLAGSSLLVLALGLIHLFLRPVPAILWLPLTFGGPALALLYAASRMRPKLSAAARSLDREGDHEAFFTSAWEAYTTPEPARSAGARALLEQVDNLPVGFSPPSGWLSFPRWYRRIEFVPWSLVAAGLFLLQLPGTSIQPTSLTAAASISHQAGQAQRTLAPSRKSAEVRSDTRVVEAERPSGLIESVRRPEHSAPPGAQPLAEELQAQLPQDMTPAADLSDRQSASMPAVASQAARAGPAAATGAGAAAGFKPATKATGESLFNRGVEFVDISRRPKVGGASVAGDEASELESDRTPGAGPGLMPAQIRPIAVGALADGGHFSLTQRQQIARYFEQIQELP